MGVSEPQRQLYLAVTKTVFDKKFKTPGVQLVLKTTGIKVITFDEIKETIESWEK